MGRSKWSWVQCFDPPQNVNLHPHLSKLKSSSISLETLREANVWNCECHSFQIAMHASWWHAKRRRWLQFDLLYAPVAAHESIRILLAISASQNLNLERFDISDAYLYGNIDVLIDMHQPFNSAEVLQKPDHYYILQKSLYVAKQAGRVWCDTLHEQQNGTFANKGLSRVSILP